MIKITDAHIRDAEAAFLVVLAEHGLSPDIGELLVRGDGRGKVAPGGLRKALTRALEAAEAARVKGGRITIDGTPYPNGLKAEAPTIPEGFIPWPGGECPVASGTRGKVLLRDGSYSVSPTIWLCDWFHDTGDKPWEIIAYRIHKPADFRLEAGKFYVDATGKREGPMKPYKGFTGFYADNSVGWWDSHGNGFATENGSVPDILALSSNQENSHE